jgi:hypothetical protein
MNLKGLPVSLYFCQKTDLTQTKSIANKIFSCLILSFVMTATLFGQDNITVANGYVVKMDGMDDYIRVNADRRLELQSNFSVELWAYMDNWSAGTISRTGLISKIEHSTGGYEIALDTNSAYKSIGFQIISCGSQSLTARAERSRTNLTSGWHHFVGTFDGRYAKFYTDGALSATVDIGATCSVNYPYNFDLRLGRSARNDGVGNNFFAGRIDEARIYSKVLTVAEILGHYNNGLGQTGLPENNLVAGWHFDENTGILANDFSGQNHTGMLMNSPYWLERTLRPNTINAIQVLQVRESSAVVSWVTNVPSTSKVEYGATTSYGMVVQNGERVYEHFLTLNNLTPFTTYNFKITSNTDSGQTISSDNQTFLTLDRAPTNNQFYVAPTGSSLNNGAPGSPWDLKTALSNPSAVQPGATIWLRGGTYNMPVEEGGLTSYLTGTEQAPIKVRSYPGEWAVIDGNLSNSPYKNIWVLTIQGSHTWFQDLEITNTETSNRKIDTTSSNPAERRGGSIQDWAVGTKLINMVIHDTGDGIGAWSAGSNNEYYGNVVYNNGWDAPDRLHGHGVYTQNNVGYKKFIDNTFFNGFSSNSRTGGTNASSVRNYTWKGNVFFNGEIAWLGPNIENLKVIENFTYNNRFGVGYEVNSTYLNAEVTNNYFTTGVQLFQFTNGLIFKNNTVWDSGGTFKNIVVQTNQRNPRSLFTLDNNTYYRSQNEFPFWQFTVIHQGMDSISRDLSNGLIERDFAFNSYQGSQAQTYGYVGQSWQQDLGFDLNSTYVDAPLTGTKIVVKPNQYDPNRALVVIYNWDLLNSVNVDVSGILSPGSSYKLHNVQDYFGDVITGTYNGGMLNIPMIGRTRAKPIGYDQVSTWYHDPLRPNTFPKFGVFVLVKNQQNPTSPANGRTSAKTNQ